MFFATIIVASILTHQPLGGVKTDAVFKNADECYAKIKAKVPELTSELAQRLPGVPFAIYVKCEKADTI